MKKFTVLFVGLLCLLMLFGATALAYDAPKVAKPLVLGESWPVVEENAYSGFNSEGAGFNLWVFWDDDNVYIQYDVYTDFPLGNKKTERYIFEADSLEWEVKNAAGTRQKWMIALTEAKGYEVVIRYPDRVYFVAPNEYHNVLITETDFGYRGQVILSQKQANLAEFKIGPGVELEMAVQVNDSADGETRTRILGGFVDAGIYSPLKFVE